MATGLIALDIEPDNIMIVPNADVPGGEQVKILDFGIAEVGAPIIDGQSAPLGPPGRIAARQAELS